MPQRQTICEPLGWPQRPQSAAAAEQRCPICKPDRPPILASKIQSFEATETHLTFLESSGQILKLGSICEPLGRPQRPQSAAAEQRCPICKPDWPPILASKIHSFEATETQLTFLESSGQILKLGSICEPLGRPQRPQSAAAAAEQRCPICFSL